VHSAAHRLLTVHGAFRAHVFDAAMTGQLAVAVVRGDVRRRTPLLARVHSSCTTGEAYGACDCDCAEQLDGALARIAAEGRGVLFYLLQDGRGSGFVAAARDRMLVQASGHRLTTFDAYARLGLPADARRYDAVPAMARALGVAAPLRLLTNNPGKAASLAGLAVPVAGTVPLPPGVSAWNRHYLGAKRRAGHVLAARAGRLAPLPARVRAIRPAPLRGAAHLVHVASYFLPIRLAAPAWFRVHVHVDTAADVERVLLVHRRPGGRRTPLVHVQQDVLRERFPLRRPALARRWRAAAERIVAHGAGAVVFDNARGWDEAVPADAEAAAALVVAHVGTRGVRLPGDGAGDAVARALARRGVAIVR
jgi:3,4-dihydroxy 2-butanone 4-phosphate synthase/GTP cyclohydrolase II